MSSQKFSEIQSHSMSLGSSSEERSCRRAKLATRDVSGAGEGLYGVYGEQPPLAILLHDALGATGTYDLREDVLRGVVLGQEPALLEDGDLVAYLYGLIYVVGDEDDGLLDVLLDIQELVLQPLARDRVHRPKGLVHEHDRGVRRHRARHPDPLLLAARELGRVTVAVLVRVEADELEELV